MSRLPDDIPSGITMKVPVSVSPPAAVVGVWELEIQLIQNGRPKPLATTRRFFEIGPKRPV